MALGMNKPTITKPKQLGMNTPILSPMPPLNKLASLGPGYVSPPERFDDIVIRSIPMPPQVSSPIRPSFGEQFAPILSKLQAVGRPTIAPMAPMAPQVAGMAPVPIRRPEPSYYQNLFNAKFAPLGQEYYGRGGISDESVAEANRRGLMTGGPSGVAGQLYEKTVTDPFARATANIQNQLNIIRAETEMDLAKYDAQRQDEFRNFQADVITKDRDYGIASVEAQARVDQTYLNLEAEINRAIAEGSSSERIAELNARVNTYQTLVNSENEKERIKQTEMESIRNWWNTAGQFAGGLSPHVPFEELGVPRPLETSFGDKSPSKKWGGPRHEGEYYSDAVFRQGQPIKGEDGRMWKWDRDAGVWRRAD